LFSPFVFPLIFLEVWICRLLWVLLDTIASNAVDSFSTVKDLLIPLLVGAVGGVVALVGQMFIQRRELAHAVGTELWKERSRIYQDCIAAESSLCASAIANKQGLGTTTEDQRLQEMKRFVDAITKMSPICSRPVQDAAMELLEGIASALKGKPNEIAAHFEEKGIVLLNAMREDLFIGHLDTKHRLWDAERMQQYVKDKGL
jgi:hypothetical protein